MLRLARFLKATLVSTNWICDSGKNAEMTLHDALRICAGDVPAVASLPTNREAMRRVDILRYHSESELCNQWQHLDQISRPGQELTVILALDTILTGSLRNLIQRQRDAHRLVIVPRRGHWPGTESMGDLALAPHALGWTFIEICRDLGHALESTLSTSQKDEQLVLVLPEEATKS